MSHSGQADSILTGANALFLADLYTRYLSDSSQIDPSWVAFFSSLGDEESALLHELIGASWSPRLTTEKKNLSSPKLNGLDRFQPLEVRAEVPSSKQLMQAARDSVQALMLIRSHRVIGHLIAELDPLGLEKRPKHIDLSIENYGFIEADLDRPIFIHGVLGKETATLREITDILHKTYCGSLGFEFMHLQNPAQKSWIQERIESESVKRVSSSEERLQFHTLLARADTFERFLHVKYTGAKRFGLEGGEALIPALDQLLLRASELGVDDVIFGMAHRGRLNVLANVIGKPIKNILFEFKEEASLADWVEGSGDVKYHLGTSVKRAVGGRLMNLSLASNPSHLEAVDPVVIGKVRAKQEVKGDKERKKIMGILLHGDAAFSGQGLVSECFSMSDLDGYKTGGTIHIVINNQIGFTTSPTQGRSSPYSSDVAKMIQAPIIHVNGDDVEAVVYAAKLAMDFKHTFNRDVVIDMFCYRRHGHNEMDEPAFTQPLMYKRIRAQKTTYELYTEKLIKEGVLLSGQSENLTKSIEDQLQREQEMSMKMAPKEPDWLTGLWSGFEKARTDNWEGQTAVEPDLLLKVGKALTTTPSTFNLNSKLDRLFKTKEAMFDSGQGFDWATAEALAFGTLLCEGNAVRLSGQDCGRGTFSQRHAVLIDQESGESYISLNHIQEGQARIDIYNSLLAEASVVGFEYGYSSVDPKNLVIWEAQFGDFANGAQVIIDQFVMSGEAKWFRMSGLVLLLPHGMEGQGPEHSSARLERFLQMCAENNVQVVNCTTPANYFHILRRQIRRTIRKPLILMTPKSLLRHKQAVSSLADMGTGSAFQPILKEIDEEIDKSKVINRLILCSGKVYYDLLKYREENGIKNTKILRVEQLYPFPHQELRKQLIFHPNAHVIWCQEEAQNNGAWTFIDRRLEKILLEEKFKFNRPIYVGRPEASSPATGYHKKHLQEQEKLLFEAFTVSP